MADRVAKEVTKRSNINLNLNIRKTEIKGNIQQRMHEGLQKQWEERGKDGGSTCPKESGRIEMYKTVISRSGFGHTIMKSVLFKTSQA